MSNCMICGTEMVVKPLFTSTYEECPKCSGQGSSPTAQAPDMPRLPGHAGIPTASKPWFVSANKAQCDLSGAREEHAPGLPSAGICMCGGVKYSFTSFRWERNLESLDSGVTMKISTLALLSFPTRIELAKKTWELGVVNDFEVLLAVFEECPREDEQDSISSDNL